MRNKGNNCDLCKNTRILPKIGKICVGKKFCGKVIDDDNNTICEEYEFGGFIELAEGIKKIPGVQFNLDPIPKTIIAKVADARECACIEAIGIWARVKGYDDVLLLNESKLKEIIRLGFAEYERLHVED